MVGSGVRGHDLFMAARQVRFGCDVGLQIRMLLTMAVLGSLYLVLVVVLLVAGVGRC
jgi:hypothetical protein